MDFHLTEIQRDLVALTRQLTTSHLTSERCRAVDATCPHFDWELWQAMATAGVVSAGLPASVGGGDLGLLEQCAILTELGRAVAPVPYLTHVLAAEAVALGGTDAQRTEWAAPAADGSLLLTTALADPLVDDPEQPSATAEPDAGGWVLKGAKAVVPFGTVADAFVLSARTPDGNGLFLVLPTDSGVTVVAERVSANDETATLRLTDVALARDRRLGDADAAHRLIRHAAVAASACQLGVLERTLEITAAYARTREQFGRPVGAFQAVAQRVADAFVDVDALRLTMWEAAWRCASGLPSFREVATTKFWAADAGHRLAYTAMHLHGGTGIDLDGELHRYFIAAKRTEFLFGAATTQLRRLGADLAAPSGR